jgi:2-oxoglutarate ferredoxin oxidoreductase subunit alpha/2-oxoisovalerate ferredoxin oxidoreductase alpha subunit
VTLWPFPVRQLGPLLRPGVQLLVVEASDGQLEDELRLALSHAGLRAPIASLRHHGGVLPRTSEIVDAALQFGSGQGAVA